METKQISEQQEVAYFQLMAKNPFMEVMTVRKSKANINLLKIKCLI